MLDRANFERPLLYLLVPDHQHEPIGKGLAIEDAEDEWLALSGQQLFGPAHEADELLDDCGLEFELLLLEIRGPSRGQEKTDDHEQRGRSHRDVPPRATAQAEAAQASPCATPSFAADQISEAVDRVIHQDFAESLLLQVQDPNVHSSMAPTIQSVSSCGPSSDW
jgi:hypothetical protein